jgi:hypothetical protein
VELVLLDLPEGMEIRPADLIFDPTLACCGLAAYLPRHRLRPVRDI